MRVNILGIADDVRQADQVLRALGRGGITVSDVMALLACADASDGKPSPPAGITAYAPIQAFADASVRPGDGFFTVSPADHIYDLRIAVARVNHLGHRPPTVTGIARIGLPAASGVAGDLHALGLPLPVARQIAAAVREDDVLLLVDERPGCSADAVIDTMLEGGLSRVFMVTRVVEREAAQRMGGCVPDGRGGADRPSPSRRWNLLPF